MLPSTYMSTSAREEAPKSIGDLSGGGRDVPGGRDQAPPRDPSGGRESSPLDTAAALLDAMADLPGVMTVAQVARLFQVHDRTVRRWIRDGRMQSLDLGSRVVRIRRAEVGYIMEHGLRPKAAHAGGEA